MSDTSGVVKQEAQIIIGGRPLTDAQARALRLALSSFVVETHGSTGVVRKHSTHATEVLDMIFDNIHAVPGVASANHD